MYPEVESYTAQIDAGMKKADLAVQAMLTVAKIRRRLTKYVARPSIAELDEVVGILQDADTNWQESNLASTDENQYGDRVSRYSELVQRQAVLAHVAHDRNDIDTLIMHLENLHTVVHEYIGWKEANLQGSCKEECAI